MKIGDRVRLHAPSPCLRLTSDLGRIVRPHTDNDLGYWVVRLDSPAFYCHHDGVKCDECTLSEVVELDDNLTLMAE